MGNFYSGIAANTAKGVTRNEWNFFRTKLNGCNNGTFTTA